MNWRQQRMTCRLLSVLLFAGCSAPDNEELQSWMAKVRSEAAPLPASEPRPQVITSVTYDPTGLSDPFDAGKITAISSTLSGSGPHPDMQRPREPLESYPLDSLRMVGTLQRHGKAVALIQADKVLYQVRKGQHLGQDQGKVIGISDAAIDIEEIVQESAGAWVTRNVQLLIQAGK